MFASIESKQFHDFFCRIKAEPVLSFGNILVYEILESPIPVDIIKKVNGKDVGSFRHVALDKNDGIGHLFDIENNKLAGSLGPCEYIADR
jgi:hypothetical protein